MKNSVPFDLRAAGYPPPKTVAYYKQAQATNWLSAPHFFLDKLSEYPPENSGRYWDKVSRCGCDFCAVLFRPGKNIENLEKFLHFGGKRYSCRSPPDFR